MTTKSKPGYSLPNATIQSPTFQPPSYYAAANGIPYPRTPRSDPPKMSPAKASEQVDTTHYERFMPVSYLPDPSSSDSSFEFRRSNLNTSPGSLSTKSTVRRKRQSQITGLPQIEAQLLPSLRDTISRMTRPPSCLSPAIPIVKDDGISRSLHHHLHDSPDHTDHHSDFSSNAHHGCLELAQTPRAQPPTPKRVLTPVYPSADSEDRRQDTSRPDTIVGRPSMRTPTLRSVKSLLTRKLSTNSTNTISSTGSSKKPIHKNIPHSVQPSPATAASSSPRKRHQTPVTSPFITPPSQHPPAESKPHLPSESSTFRQLPKPPRSNIPRFRARFAPNSSRSENSDSSDIERHSTLDRKDQRKLTVINTIAPATSCSDNESDISPHLGRIRPHLAVGLGLDCHFPAFTSPRPEINDRYSESEDSTNIGPRSSIASSISRYSSSSDDQPSALLEQRTSGEMQQRAALLSLVSSLEQKPQRRATQSSESSEYYGEQGVAYSASCELDATRGDSFDPTHVSSHGYLPMRVVQMQPVESKRPGSLPLSSLGSSQPPEDDERPLEDEIGVGAAARLARRSLMVATRAREAFGLKPSDSDEYHQRFEGFYQRPQFENRLSESTVSDVMGAIDNTLSHGASHMLQSIKGKHQPFNEVRQNINGDATEHMDPKRHHPQPISRFPSLPPQSDLSSVEDILPLPSILQQLLETEKTFVANLRTCIQLYVLPLRLHGSKAWISGVPSRVSRFLDWLEDILHLHERLLEIFRGSQIDVVRDLISFIPNFEIYQPYIALLTDFAHQLRHLMEDGSDFGNFVVLQDKQAQRSGLSLSKYIFEPEKRLQKYIDLFSALVELTPRHDPQYLSIFSFLHSMGLVLDVLDTVKQEEEKHWMLSSLLDRFQSSRSLTFLADRKRALLWHGPVTIWFSPEGDFHDQGSSFQVHRTRRLSKAITAWDAQRDAQTSLRGSISSYGSALSCSSSIGDSQGSSSLQARSVFPAPVDALILSDLILLGERDFGSSRSYRLLDNIGMARIFSAHHSGEAIIREEAGKLTVLLGSLGTLLELIPIDSVDSTPSDISFTIKAVYISSTLASGTSSPQNCDKDLVSALHRSAQNTLQLWCRPWKSNKAVEGDDATQFLTSLLGSGLPLPKSPSGRFPKSSSREGDASIQEREERGWWSFRFHQVMYAKRQMVLNPNT
ncbi:hypothetical protein AN958_01660 [Leucoagaricus sp. SymC.cos]|nr:hypothetical protein AN958_01660 [Leucoagaricus sp. SymC.cos]